MAKKTTVKKRTHPIKNTQVEFTQETHEKPLLRIAFVGFIMILAAYPLFYVFDWAFEYLCGYSTEKWCLLGAGLRAYALALGVAIFGGLLITFAAIYGLVQKIMQLNKEN
jgi:sterol desaturase/sphingolipid hydroxylase (fatty acid hydroxylase superfamily)